MLLLLLSSVCLLPGLAGTDGQIKKGVFSWNYFSFLEKKDLRKDFSQKSSTQTISGYVYIYIDIL